MNQVIIFKDKTNKTITESQASLIFQASVIGKTITIPNFGEINFSDIEKIITVEEFTQGNQQIRYPTKNAAELMKRGFIDYKLNKGKSREQAEQEFNEFTEAKFIKSL